MKFTPDQITRLNKHQLSRYHLHIESEKRKERKLALIALVLAIIVTLWRHYGN